MPISAPQPAPLGFSNGQLETLKWLALASMFLDHFGRHLLGWPQDSWVFAGGRFAFPLFTLVLGVNLARPGDQARRAGRTALRLAAWGAVSVLPSIWARGDPQMVNVLGTLSLGALLCWALASPAPAALRLLVCAGAAVAAGWMEFGIGGVFLVPAVWLFCTRQDAGTAIVALSLLLATAWLNGQFGGWPAFACTVGALGVAAVVRALPVSMPRWQHLFYLGYPAHLALIGWLKHAA
jgi:hypothetical protein